MGAAIDIRHASVRYGAEAVLKDCSLSLRAGEIFALLGASGCGKTTLLRVIAGLCPLDGGTLSFDGVPAERALRHRPRIGLAFQDQRLFPALSVRDNLEVAIRGLVPEEEHSGRQAEAFLEKMGILELADKKPGELSGGQQKRASLARALAVRPDILLLDEPFSGLHHELRRELRRYLREFQREIGCTTVLVSHDREDAEAIADRIGLMRDGSVETGETDRTEEN